MAALIRDEFVESLNFFIRQGDLRLDEFDK